jgi:hypothetical protein
MSEVRTTPAIRWGGIVGGALIALVAGAGIVVLAVPDPNAVVGWIRPLLFSVRPEWFGAVIPLGIGVLAIVLGGIFVARRRQPGGAEES